ncbi:MAG: large-conductance mechanosensitive channel protein MscL [Flavobacteriales bacterium]|nr:large-conductance mechanosensitive channel protein MscL [Flavobacteriales bacterium]
MLKEFKEFAMKGNLIDLAVGFVMGAAFTKLTSSFIEGMVMPLVGLIQGKDLTEWKYVMKAAEGESAEVSLKYGTFLTVTIEFIIVAFVMFMVVKAINKMKKAQPAPAPAGPTTDQVLLTEIRDLLKK